MVGLPTKQPCGLSGAAIRRYLLVATGRADLMIDPIMSIWDAAAILPVIEEAGGRFKDWSGRATVASK